MNKGGHFKKKNELNTANESPSCRFDTFKKSIGIFRQLSAFSYTNLEARVAM